ncbi:hypothetical protein DAPPUDRAFT_119448 [Daphnia pulex]|uniref:Uncharacterized protein n=1 Tax=Daphnia pulex TaxID=6669 RepID=E9HYJ7_DAPPU|nr:hypothetical protein DAPPUDRAFT_119448 [Daphnia pulex]|eukprot:EFX63182.1 hypothetical protein DAPPUDRAFT_119448 [Daphnia pulex]
MGVPVVGIGKTIDKAKWSPAVKMLMEIRKSTQNEESLNEVKTPELVTCGEWMKKYPSVKAIILHEETPTEDPRQEHSRWILENWLKERRRVMPFYMCVAFEDFTFSISCEGQTITDRKNNAASKMSCGNPTIWYDGIFYKVDIIDSSFAEPLQGFFAVLAHLIAKQHTYMLT